MSKHKQRRPSGRPDSDDHDRESDFAEKIGRATGLESVDVDDDGELDLESVSIEDLDEEDEDTGDESLDLDVSKVMPEFLESFVEMQEAMRAEDDDPDDIGLEKKIGNDDRARVTNTRKTPFTAICLLRIKFAGGREKGTGWLVGPRLIITAGHCVFDRDNRRFAESIEIHPGRDGSQTFFTPQIVSGNRLRTTSGYKNRSTPDREIPDVDFGAILLPRPFAGAGHFGFDDYSDSKLRGETLNLVGYPGERPFTMWGHARKILEARRRRLVYQIDSTAGQSGSPVYDFIRGANGKPNKYVVVGIHNASSTVREQNYAARITTAHAALIDGWKRESAR